MIAGLIAMAATGNVATTRRRIAFSSCCFSHPLSRLSLRGLISVNRIAMGSANKRGHDRCHRSETKIPGKRWL